MMLLSFSIYPNRVNSKLKKQQQTLLQKLWFTTSRHNFIQKENIKYQNSVTKNNLH